MRNRREVGNFLFITDKVEKIIKVFEIALHKFEEDRFLEFVFCRGDEKRRQRTCLQLIFQVADLVERIGGDDQLAEIRQVVDAFYIIAEAEDPAVDVIVVFLECHKQTAVLLF